MSWTDGLDRAEGTLITTTIWNSYLGTSGSLMQLKSHSHGGTTGEGSTSLGPLVLADFTTAAAPAAPGASKGRFYVVTGDRPGFRSGAAGAAEVLSTLSATETHTGAKTFSGTVQMDGFLGLSTAAAASALITATGSPAFTGTAQYGIRLDSEYTAEGTATAYGIYSRVRTVASAYTLTDTIGVFIATPVKGAGSTITNAYGLRIASQTAGGTTNYGVYVDTPSGGSGTNYGVYIAGGAPALYIQAGGATLIGDVNFGVATSSLGVIKMNGNTSGTITIQSAAAAGTWTWTLPPDDGDAGEQLQTNGSGVTTWEAAASYRDAKELWGKLDPKVALRTIVDAQVWRFKYVPGTRGVGGDYETLFAGVVADEAPWAMMHKGKIFNPISAFGYAAAAIQELAGRLDRLEEKAYA